jgi:CRP/FNR family cyclic AMP-dependent transcriptional regulator
MSSGLQRVRQTVLLLDADPDLAAGLDPQQQEAARRHAVAPVIEIEGPGWDTGEIAAAADTGWLGLFVLEGLMMRRVTVGKRAACELFGPSDIIRPWDADGEYDPLPITVDWLVPETSRLAVLDTAFAIRTARWPSVTSKLIERVAQRARYLALTQAVTHLPRTHPRLLMLFWLLAERWGRVTPAGVQVTLPLTHEVLAMLVGSHRPTVTIALQRLARAGLLLREGHDRWLLTARAIEYLGQPESMAMIGEEAADPIG